MSETAKSHLKQNVHAFRPTSNGLLQRKCACGNHTLNGEQCAECAKKNNGLQRKLSMGSVNDPLEREAGRIADQVTAIPAFPTVSGALPRIQRLTTQSAGRMDSVPDSVNQALASPGRLLEPGLRQDMEQRFGYDFSQVRVHSDSVAEQSARAVEANAYTVGHDIVFGPDRFTPSTREGRRLLAHELTHVVQQSGAEKTHVGRGIEKPGSSSIAVQRAPVNHENPSKQRYGSTLPYREAKNLADCLRIMGADNAQYCYREVLGEEGPSAASQPTAPPSVASKPSVTTIGKKSARINALDQSRGCAYTITYSNLREVDCDTVWKSQKGSNPPGPLCGTALVYDITSVTASGSKCPNLNGLRLSEVVKGDHGCTPPNFVWAAGSCTIGPGGKITGCTDTLSVCGLTSDLKGDCTEFVDQEIEIGGQLAEEHELVYELKKDKKSCTGKVTRN